MENPAPPLIALRFGLFELDLQAGELRKSGVKIKLQEQPLQVLIALLQKPGEVVTREELRMKLWDAETFVDVDHSLGTAINKIREVLGDSAENPRFVETLPRRGYRFIAPVNGFQRDAQSPATTGQSDPLKPANRPSSRWQPLWLRVATGIAVAFAITVFAWGIGRRWVRAGESHPSIRSLAVLPLANLSNDPEQEFFADGMTDELTTSLAKVSALRVISRSSVMRYRNTQKPLAEIGKELGADALIEGTVLRSGNSVRITVQLIDASTDRHLWAEEYQRDAHDVLELQADVARAITTAVQVKLTPQQQLRLASAPQVDPEAHDAYLRGLYFFRKGEPESTEKAIGYFEQAMARNPSDPLIYAALSDAYSSLTPHARAPLDVLPKAKAAAARAIELDDTLADAHASLAYIKLWFDWDWPGAQREYQRALELNPNLFKAHTGYAAYLATIGRAQDAIEEAERAHQLDPVSLTSLDSEASVFIFSRRYAEAVELSRRKIELEPNADRAYAWLAVTQTLLGHHAEAVNAADHAVQGSRGRTPYEAVYAYAMAGQKERARKMFASLLDPSGKPYVCGYNMGIISLALGEKDRAVDWLEKAYRDHST
jgi:TolB-like protein/DNA-binding winged helix-turn-helix (wHTH) protein/Flp pilus assembly protein TadD